MPTEADGVFSLLWLIVALPAIGATVLLVGGRRTDRWGHLLGCAMPIGSFLVGVVMFIRLLGRDGEDRQVSQQLWTWLDVGDYTVQVGLLYDQLSALFVLLITGVGSLIHVYSVGYMAHDDRRRRFFGFLNLFVTAMLVLVLADDYLAVFLGWEGVGLASYLLIGFWAYKDSAATAANKAFVVNRVGDLGMSAGRDADDRDVRHLELHRCVRRHARGVGLVWPPRSACCCCSRPAASPRRSRCRRGCSTRWKARHRCPP